jgi:hypothetical protein
MDVAGFLEVFTPWAREQTDIDAVALVGSYARGTATKDSDVDLMILSSSITQYFASKEWLSQFGAVRHSETETWGKVETLRVFYETGCEIEYNFAAPSWADIPVDPGTKPVVDGGMKILFDRNQRLHALQQAVVAERASTN